ncbi:MAG: nucleoside deaminase [Alphaproteobacteria bacterium]|nr:nucleoside deaminase [Alphaproteobacteria bacterium]
MDRDSDIALMRLALEQAEAAVAAGEVPIGAVLVDADGRVVARAHNLVERLKDPTAHAEMLVIREAARLLDAKRLPGCSLYVTLEPCAMCATAASFARLARVVFGAEDPKGGGVVHGARVFTQTTCHWRCETIGGIEAEASADLLRAFFRARRS